MVGKGCWSGCSVRVVDEDERGWMSVGRELEVELEVGERGLKRGGFWKGATVPGLVYMDAVVSL